MGVTSFMALLYQIISISCVLGELEALRISRKLKKVALLSEFYATIKNDGRLVATEAGTRGFGGRLPESYA